MPRLPKQDTELLEAALIGFLHQKDEVQRKIAELRSRIGEPSVSGPAAATAGSPAPKRTLSPAARRRIALAQKKRWAAQKAKNGQPPASSKPRKRVLSAAGRARIIAATKKRWAAFRKAQETRKAS
jgi:hypothetical protein